MCISEPHPILGQHIQGRCVDGSLAGISNAVKALVITDNNHNIWLLSG
jgi:hypothetical protein